MVARPDRGEPRPGVVELGGDHVPDAGLQRGARRPGLKSERPAGPPCRARAVPCPLTSADRDHAASANPARGAGYHALFRALVSLTQYIRLLRISACYARDVLPACWLPAASQNGHSVALPGRRGLGTGRRFDRWAQPGHPEIKRTGARAGAMTGVGRRASARLPAAVEDRRAQRRC